MPSLRDSGKIIGESVSIKELALRCPGVPIMLPLSLRWFISAPLCPFPARIRLHIKVLTPPSIDVDTMIEAMRIVYATAGIRVEIASREDLTGDRIDSDRIDALTDLDVLDCGISTNALSLEQLDLFTLYDNNVGNNEIVVYFVNTTVKSFNGCAMHPTDKPGAVVASIASQWTLAHEVGHVLGLHHISGEGGDDCDTPDVTRLMTGCGTSDIIGTPTLSEHEIKKMNRSNLVVAG